jgi:hypothetical protein
VPEQSDARLATLREALKERYHAMQTIRDRAEKMCVWSLGVLLLIAGWIIEKGVRFDFKEKIALAAILFVALTAVRVRYLRDLESGFRTQQRIAVQLELELGLFPPYPESWRMAGSSNGPGRYFSSLYWLMYLGAFLLISSLFFQLVLSLLGFHSAADGHDGIAL